MTTTDKIETVSLESDPTMRYGILFNISQQSITVVRFHQKQEILDLVLSPSYPQLVLYRTQYSIPTVAELEEIEYKLFSTE